VTLARLDSSDTDFDEEIIAAVRGQGDAALLHYTSELDGYRVTSAVDLEIDLAAATACLAALGREQRQALETAAERIRSYHTRQRAESWSYRDEDGTLLGQQVRPLDRVGVYVPGGKAAYPSTVLMNLLPAKVAGVAETVMVVPCPAGERNSLVLAAAAVAGADRIFSIGGAQAVAALAFGTETVPAVHKIVGPGNRYVAEAKRQVFGQVGIDMIAGPSEILIVCDGTTAPEWVALDLFAQAEHDPVARALLVTPDPVFADQVEVAVKQLLPGLQRKEIVTASLRDYGAIVTVNDLPAAMALVNQVAPEHLELLVENPEQWLPEIRHAGAIFLGRYSSEALGDYCAGPNHVLPTAGTARFSSPLGVYDFQKRSSIIGCSAAGAARLGAVAVELATAEGLEAHARSAAARMSSGRNGGE